MFAGQRVLVTRSRGDLVASPREYIAARRDVAPAVEGRITIVK